MFPSKFVFVPVEHVKHDKIAHWSTLTAFIDVLLGVAKMLCFFFKGLKTLLKKVTSNFSCS